MMRDHDLLRVFCAIALPAELCARAESHIAQLRRAVPGVRASWERAEKMHITLKFLGAIEAGRLDALANATARAAQSVPAFELAIEGAGAFPPHGHPKVLWLGVSDSTGALALLQRRLEKECAAENFAREARPFHPHLTVARLRAPKDAKELAARHAAMGFETQPFACAELLTMQSQLSQRGSLYTILSRHKFGRE